MGGLLACSETLVESYTVNGVGELCVAMRLNCHPPKIWRTGPCAPAGRCGCQDPLPTTRCRASNRDGPCSAARSKGFCARSFSPANGSDEAPPRFIDEWSSSAFENQ